MLSRAFASQKAILVADVSPITSILVYINKYMHNCSLPNVQHRLKKRHGGPVSPRKREVNQNRSKNRGKKALNQVKMDHLTRLGSKVATNANGERTTQYVAQRKRMLMGRSTTFDWAKIFKAC